MAGRKNKVVVEKIDFIEAVERSIAVSKFVLDNIDFISLGGWTLIIYAYSLVRLLSNRNIKLKILVL